MDDKHISIYTYGACICCKENYYICYPPHLDIHCVVCKCRDHKLLVNIYNEIDPKIILSDISLPTTATVVCKYGYCECKLIQRLYAKFEGLKKRFEREQRRCQLERRISGSIYHIRNLFQ